MAASSVVSAAVLSGMLATAGPGKTHVWSIPGAQVSPAEAQTVAYRTTAAVKAASGAEIEHPQVSYGAGPRPKATSEQGVYGSSWRSEQFEPDGIPLFGISEIASGCATSVRAVSYTDHTFYEGPGGILMAGPDEEFAQSDVADQIRRELADGQLRSMGRTEVAGKPVLELNGTVCGAFEIGLPAGCTPPASDVPLIAKTKNSPGWD